MAGRPVDSVRCAVFHETSGIVEHAPAQHCGPANRATAKPNPRTASIPRNLHRFFSALLKIRIHDLTRKKELTAWGPAALRTMADEDGSDPDNTRLYQVLGVDKSVRSATAAPPRASSCIHPHLKATPMQRKECDETAQQKNRVVWWPRTGGHCHPAVPHLRESTATVPSVNTPFSFVVTLPKARWGMLLQRVLRRVNLCCAIFILVFPAVCLWWRVAT
jgi:hypothetical protein